MLIPISKMASQVQPSATLAAGAKARQLKADGIQVFDFSLGEPDFNTPEHICKAAYQAMKDGHTHYTPAAGIAELRGAIAKSYRKVGLEVTAEQVIVSNGAKHSLHNTLAALVGPGDEVIIPSPYWVSYSDLVQMTGASFVLVPTTAESGFRMSPEQFRDAVQPAGIGSARRGCAKLESGGAERRDLREAGLRRRDRDLLRDAAAGAAGADGHDQRR